LPDRDKTAVTIKAVPATSVSPKQLKEENVVTSILVVEDSWLTRRVICKILRAEGYETWEASCGPEALEILSTQTPNCMLLDLLMPEMEGREVLQAMREKGFKIPVIVITADIQSTTRSECMELGALAVIHKMPNSGELIGWIKKALSASEESAP
jgi:Response regulator containing CheY-like receiver, AAA-type ATPase, and DNA-binding domains